MGKQELDAVDIVDEELFERARALVLDGAQRLALQLGLHGATQVAQDIEGGIVRDAQPLHVEESMEDAAGKDGERPGKRLGGAQGLVLQQGADDLKQERVLRDVGGERDEHHPHRRVGAALVRACVGEYVLEHVRFRAPLHAAARALRTAPR